jgi:hypothetical protein
MSSWIRDLAEMLETHFVEVKHKGQLKLWHPETLAHGRLLMSWYTERTGGPPPPHCHHWPARPPPRWAATHQPTRLQPAHCPTGLAGHWPAGPPAYWQWPTTGGLQHHQTLTPNLPRGCRQIGLDAKVVTTEILRLKLYCSRNRDFCFLLFFSFL